jgi:hypothetical protein
MYFLIMTDSREYQNEYIATGQTSKVQNPTEKFSANIIFILFN